VILASCLGLTLLFLLHLRLPDLDVSVGAVHVGPEDTVDSLPKIVDGLESVNFDDTPQSQPVCLC
jgi:hypothetical protein